MDISPLPERATHLSANQQRNDMPILCPRFDIPYFVISCGRIYLSGHSYYRLTAIDDGPDLAPLYVSKAESDAVNNLKIAIVKIDFAELRSILDYFPTLPRLMNSDRDQEAHESLFGLLLVMGRLSDLERLYGIATSDGTSHDGDYKLINQRETFGSRAALIHEKILVNLPEKQDRRWPVRGLVVDKMVGKGSYGYVFLEQKDLWKFSLSTSEYVREFLTHSLLTLFSTALPPEVQSPIIVSDVMIQNHLLRLYPLQQLTRDNINSCSNKSLPRVDQFAQIIKQLFFGVCALRDRFIMHLDISTTNVMWDPVGKNFRIIDYGGTIGDDSFLDIGTIVNRICTRTTRAPEYSSSETIWQRNESSEALTAYYSIMSYLFDPSVLAEQPYVKGEMCLKHIKSELEATGSTTPEITCLRRVHTAAHSLPKDRPPLEWILSSGTDDDDRKAMEMGSIGSLSRFIHMKQCLGRYITQWPKGHTLSAEWFAKRTNFILLIISRINCTTYEGVSCGGLIEAMVPPPYTTVRCITIYDALCDIVREGKADHVLSRYVTETSCYAVLANAIIYLSLAPAKTPLVEVEYYANHPLHVILRAFLEYPNLVSLFLSPITAYTLLLLETPRADQVDAATLENRFSPTVGVFKPETSHRMIRCLYNLKTERRSQPMHDPKIREFAKYYMTRLMEGPIIVENESDWWKLFKTQFPYKDASNRLYREHINNILRLWFT
jgi:serine/threonine protein kinase